MEEIDDVPCDLCKSKKKDNLKYGQFYIKDGIHAHYFCLLLTSNLPQNGKDEEGILGFLPKHINIESKRVKSNICTYCKKKGANIGCCKEKCRQTFHFICGIENGAQNQFYGTYRSFCNQHTFKSIQKQPPAEEFCTICFENFLHTDFYTMTLRTPCCKSGWFHKWCLQKFANSSGYFFKCPLCNDTTKFVEQLPYVGIFIPQKDAEWEMETDAFQELLERPNICSATTCLCDLGRNFTDSNKFKFIFCYTCGSIAIHESCVKDNIKELNENYICIVCAKVVNNLSLRNVKARDSGIVKIERNSSEDEVINIDDLDDDDEDYNPKSILNTSIDNLSNTNENSFEDQNTSEVVEKVDILTKSDERKFSITNVDLSIVEGLKKVYENIESVRKLYKTSSMGEKESNKKSKSDTTATSIAFGNCSLHFDDNEKNSENYTPLSDAKTNLSTASPSTSSGRCVPEYNNLSNPKSRKLPKKIEKKIRNLSKNITFSTKHEVKKTVISVNYTSTANSFNNEMHKELKLSNDFLQISNSDTYRNYKKDCSGIERSRTKRPIYDSNLKPHSLQRKPESTDRISTSIKKRLRSRSSHKLHILKKLRHSSEKNKEQFIDCQTDKYCTQIKSRMTRYRSRSRNLSDDSVSSHNDTRKKLPYVGYQNKESKTYKNRGGKFLCNTDSDSNSSISIRHSYYLHNKNVLKKNLKKKLSPINLKIKSKYSILKSRNVIN